MQGLIEAVKRDRTGFLIKENGADLWFGMPKGQTIPNNVNKGDTVSFEFTVNGTWKNIQGMVSLVGNPSAPVATSSPAPSNSSQYGNKFPVKPDTTDHCIMRQNALSAAANLFAGKGADITPEAVLGIAEQFVAWTTGRNA